MQSHGGRILKKRFQLFLLVGRDEERIHGFGRGKVHGLHQGANAFDTSFFVVPESDHIDYLLIMGVNAFG